MALETSTRIPLKTLSSGHDMPVVALGTIESSFGPDKAIAAIIEAIKIGYRHFDTASLYGSEGALGDAIAEAVRLGLIGSRADVFITSKLWCTDNHPERVLSAIKTSLRCKHMEQLQLQDSMAVGDVEAQISEPGPEHNTGWLGSVVDLTLGPYRSDPIWRLRLLAAFSLVVAAMVGVFFLPGDLHGIHSTYRRLMLITIVGAPIVVAAISLFVSFWLTFDPHGRSITGLLVANISVLGSSLTVCWMLTRGTGN